MIKSAIGRDMRVKEAFILKDDEISELNVGSFTDGEFEAELINVYPVKRQKLIGFGGAFTDSAAYNYAQMSAEEKTKTLESLFGESGLRYNFCRLCVGSSDFAADEYCYVKDNDETLESFSIERDKKYVIPFVKDAISYATYPFVLLASPWSPPAFMKTNGDRFKGGKLKPECYALYAEYLAKFLLAYRAEGINVSMLSLQNEAKAIQTWESCTYTADEEAEFALVLSDILKKRGLGDVKLLCWDHNKERLFERADKIFKRCGNKIDGIAFHWYSGDHFEAVDLTSRIYPDKLLLETEFCKTLGATDAVDSGYSREIINNLSRGAHGICEWNLILDSVGGPFHNRDGGCVAPIKFDGKNISTTFVYRESYMFSHFIRPDATALYSSSFDAGVFVSAFENPDGSVVLNVLNDTERDFCRTQAYINGKFLPFELPSKALVTIVIS